MRDFDTFERSIGTTFKNKSLLRQALVHRSYLNENEGFELDHNERLEFLGDAVLEIVVTEFLYHRFPEKPEGELTNLRASLVNAKMLAQVAQELGVEDNLYLSKGESKDSNSKARSYILADAVEAVIGAIYLDAGIAAARTFIETKILSHLDEVLEGQLYLDPKSTFQEKVQELYSITPHYEVLSESGPDHAKVFQVGVFIGQDLVARGNGTSKQEAQVQAAVEALKKQRW